MASRKDENFITSRRTFLKGMRWAPMLLLPAPLHGLPVGLCFPKTIGDRRFSLPFSDSRLTPHYPAKSPLEDVLRQVIPGGDEYVTEKYAWEIMQLLGGWSQALKSAAPALDVVAKILDPSIEGASLSPTQETALRAGGEIEIYRRRFAAQLNSGREQFLHEIKTYFSQIARVEVAEFEITGIEKREGVSPTFLLDIRYDLVGTRRDSSREQRAGRWLTLWSRSPSNAWQATRWEATEETVSRAREPLFVDVTSQVLGQTESYQTQLLRGVDDWRAALDAACGIDIYGNNGVAVGDIDNDGWDEIYVCQPSGLPNRLYRNRGDGTFEDVTEKSGVGVLDGTACAIFADFENKGLQDLLVVCGGGPLLFLNQGNGKFSLKRDAFNFVRPPQGTFTHAAVADYDRDGLLDIYFCLYSYYLGLDQYHYPTPYFDARNGPPNFLFHNEGNGIFRDRTQAARLDMDNDRYSFACAWGDCNSDGWPDLYVANDFGRSNLYRNNGNGTFTVISSEAGVEDAGAGMSACWCDFDGDGKQDIYVGNMWSAAGLRVSNQNSFHPKDPETIRALYRQHARGNSLYQNQGNGHFKNVSQQAAVGMGRWAWSSDAWDFDHDGYPDLYIANGYISGVDARDLSSFFWRQVVAKSAPDSSASFNYERGWNAINELIRSDATWNGRERNVLYLNNHDGTFSDVSGIAGLDFPDDSRSFALADLDHDGRIEIILKNRNAPQLRILRNSMKNLGHSIAFRLRGTKSNRDAVGAAVTVDAAEYRQTKYLQAGSGFLSQHTKDLFFGVGTFEGTVRATIRWPSGDSQSFDRLPINHRIEIEEGSEKYLARPFAASPKVHPQTGEKPAELPSLIETWLIQPLNAPEFSLPGIDGKQWELRSFQKGFLLLNFWMTDSPSCRDQLSLLRQYQSKLTAGGLQIVAVNLDDPPDVAKVRSFVSKQGLSFPILMATQDVAGIYNIIYRYLFDRRRDLGAPTSFLIDPEGMIVKVYQGPVNPERLLEDVRSVPRTVEDRIRKALPFEGKVYQGEFLRNDFTYGVAFFQRGYLEQAATSFKQVITARPDDPEAYYNLGTLYLRRNDSHNARQYLEQAVKMRPNYPEAWNNLGMVAVQQKRDEEAIQNFTRSLELRPDYLIALVNLGNFYRRQKSFANAEKLLLHAVEIEPDDPEANYSLGMLYAQQDQTARALEYLEKAVNDRPDYPDALNNLGVILVRERRYPEAEEKFKACIKSNANFDQAYLNLARLYVILDDKEKAKEVLLSLLHQQPQHKMAQEELEMLH